MAEKLGKPLMPWQQAVANVAFEVHPDTGLPAYQNVCLTVPRQSGKTTLILAAAIHRMIAAKAFGGGRQTVVYTAQTRNDSREKFVEDYITDLQAALYFKGMWHSRLSNGSEHIKWNNGSRFGIESTTEKAGHGKTLDLAFVDEAFSHDNDRVEQGLKVPMITRPYAQFWTVSTAGTEKSSYLRGKIESGRALVLDGCQDGTAYFEWSADLGPDADETLPATWSIDIEDPRTWWECMPALGHTVTEAGVRSFLQSMKPDQFMRAFLNLWLPENYGDTIIPMPLWRACADTGARIEGEPVFAVDVAPDSSWASIAVAGAGADGRPMVEIVEYGTGDGWVVERLAGIRDRLGSIKLVLDAAGPAGALLNDLRQAEITPEVINARQLTQACGGIKRAVLDGTMRHTGQKVLSDALAGAATRELLDAWAWRRRLSSADICPLVAATLALWGHGIYAEPVYDLGESFG